jgi:hypothetical protein
MASNRESDGDGAPRKRSTRRRRTSDPLLGIEMRLTYRTMRVLLAIAEHPGATNREVAEHSDTKDEGQISRLLGRLQQHTLIENKGEGKPRGGANAWRLTERGEAVHHLIAHWQGR